MYRKCAYWIAILAFFLWFAMGGLRAYFSPDDMQNIYGYWNLGWWGVIKANAAVFTSAYRPLGGLYYYTIYTLFGMELAPYRVVALSLVLANIFVMYVFLRRLTGSSWTALAATALAAVHPGLVLIYYSNATIYDILCFTFYYATLAYYVGVRNRAEDLHWKQVAVVCIGYALALNAKEMAVTLPLFVAAFEITHPSQRRWGALWLLSLMTLAYVAGKRFGPDSLWAIDAYRPVISLARFFDTSVMELRQVLHDFLPITRLHVCTLYSVMAAVAIILRSRMLALAMVLAVGGFLPVNFIPPRESFVIYLPLAGWALYAAVLLEKVTPRYAPATALALMVLINAPGKSRMLFPIGAQTPAWDVLQQLKTVHPSPYSCVLLENDPFHPFWDTYFMAKLVFNDRTMHIAISEKEGAERRGDLCERGPDYRVVFEDRHIRRFDRFALSWEL